MRCPKAKKILSDYLDDNLSSRKRIQLEAHLRDCPDCDAELAQLRSLNAMLQEAGKVEVPEEYWDNYWNRLSVKLPPIKAPSNWNRGILRLFRQPIPAVYALLAVLLVGLAVFFSDSYLDSRKVKSPEVAIATGDSYHYQPATAGRPSRTTTLPASSLSLKEELAKERKNAAVTEQPDRLEQGVDGIESKEMAAKRGEMFDELKKSSEIAYGRTKLSAEKREIRASVKKDAPRKPADTKVKGAGIQPEMNKREKLAMDETAEMRGRAEIASEAFYEAPELAPADEPAEAEALLERAAGAEEDAEKLQYKWKSARGVRHRLSDARYGVSTSGEKYAEPYGLIIRVLKINPANAKLNIAISKGTGADNIFLSALKKENPKANLEFVLSSKTKTFAGKETSLTFRSSTPDYTFQLKVLPPSDNQKEHRLAYLKHYSTPKPGETVIFDIPDADSDENNFVVLVTRCQQPLLIRRIRRGLQR